MRYTQQDFYNLYYGGYHVTDNERYLWRQIAEEEAPGAYARRASRVAYPNFQAKIINIMTDFVFWGAPKITGETELDLVSIGRDQLTHSLIGGYSFALILTEGVKIYPGHWVEFNEDKTIVIKSHADETRQVEIRIIPATENDEGEIMTGRVDKMVDDKIIHTEAFTNDQLKKCFYDSTGLSFIRDSAPINVQIYNFQSVLDLLIFHSAILVSSGPDLGNAKKAPNNVHIPRSGNETEFQFHIPGTQQMVDVRKEIDRRIAIMAAAVGLQSEFAEDMRIETGEARKWKMLDTNATVLQMAVTTSRNLNHIAQVYSDITATSEATIELEPLLNPSADVEKIEKLDNLIMTVSIDEIIKEAQKEKVKISLSDISEARLNDLLDLVEKEGGQNSVNRTELSLNPNF